jgi:acyl-CoA synthetase (AMP-forming)/AMP-acid ligase II
MIRSIEPLPRGENPFSLRGITRGADGIARYDGLPASLPAMLRGYVDRTPAAEAIAEAGGERVTYRELWERAARIAGGLRARNIGRGDRAAIRLPNGLAWVEAFFGTLFAGAVAVPVNTRFAQPEVEYVVSDSGSSFVFEPGEPLPDGEPYACAELAPDDLAAIFYTSGTTGFPKGAMTTHAAFLTNCENMLRTLQLPLERGDALRTLISVPLFHVTGCNAQLLTVMYAGGASVILPALDIPRLIRLVGDERINFLVTVPAVYALTIANPAFATADVSSVQRVGYGGAPIAPALVHRIKAAFPAALVFNGFGMTEAASLMTSLPDRYAAEHADSVGFAVPVLDLALDDVDPQSGAGELLARGPNITTGYWNKPEATKAAFVYTGGTAPRSPGDGWLRTGDVAKAAPNGLIYIVDRVKDMICRGGENVYCVEVENALAGAPNVAEAAVIGVPDDVMGEKVGLVVVPVPGTTFDVQAVIASLRGTLADFKIPQFVAIREAPLPRNPGGKVLKARLREETVWGPPLR